MALNGRNKKLVILWIGQHEPSGSIIDEICGNQLNYHKEGIYCVEDINFNKSSYSVFF